ncbi:MAG: SHOCT domain-containing protein [Desulfotignum sp.]|nr:SHOCT domain-containing protein [Desulfotignum sp.]
MDFFKIPFLIGVFLSLFAGESLALQSGDNNRHMMERWGMGGFGGFLMVIFWIIIIIGAIYLIKLLMQKTQNKDGPSDRGRSSNPQPIEILKERYAKGEIDKKEFERKKRDLL